MEVTKSATIEDYLPILNTFDMSLPKPYLKLPISTNMQKFFTALKTFDIQFNLNFWVLPKDGSFLLMPLERTFQDMSVKNNEYIETIYSLSDYNLLNLLDGVNLTGMSENDLIKLMDLDRIKVKVLNFSTKGRGKTELIKSFLNKKIDKTELIKLRISLQDEKILDILPKLTNLECLVLNLSDFSQSFKAKNIKVFKPSNHLIKLKRLEHLDIYNNSNTPIDLSFLNQLSKYNLKYFIIYHTKIGISIPEYIKKIIDNFELLQIQNEILFDRSNINGDDQKMNLKIHSGRNCFRILN